MWEGPFLSQLLCHTQRMKLNLLWQMRNQDGELLASFGGAQLVKHLDGTCEIRGGSPEERDEARDWVALFLHHVILREPARVKITAVAQPNWRLPVPPSQRASRN